MTVEELERDLVLKSQDNINLNNQCQQYQNPKLPMLPEQMFNHIQQQRFQQHQALLASGGGLENLKLLPEIQSMDPVVMATMMHQSANAQQNLILRQQHQQEHRISVKNSTMPSKILVCLYIVFLGF